MSRSREDGLNRLGDLARIHTDIFNKVPREEVIDKKLGLLSLFYIAVAPIICGNGRPIDFGKLIKIGPKLSVARPCIGEREGPPSISALLPMLLLC